MAKDKKLRHRDDLTEADLAVLRLYEDAKTPIEWDSSDDAILSFAASLHETAADSETEQAPETEDSSVVPFRRPQATLSISIFRSPLVGVAVAASLLIGVFVGQAIVPHFNPDESEKFAQILEDKERLAQQLAQYGDLEGAENYFQVVEENASLQAEIEDLRRIDATPGIEEIGAPLDTTISVFELREIFDSFDCAVLNARTAPDSRLVVEGYVGTPEDLVRLGAALAGRGNLLNRAEVAGVPNCRAIEILHRRTEVAAGQSGGPSIRPYNHGLEYRSGESLVLAATASGHFNGYLYVDLVLPDGRVRHLQPETGAPLVAVPSGQELILGGDDGGREITPPFGQLLAIVLSTPQPLFEEQRPETEAAEPYFAALNTALESAAQEAPSAGPASSYSFITTRD